jgi:hypothetical protein
MALPVAMAENEFDAGWHKTKICVEAGICSQRIFGIVNNKPIPQDNIFEKLLDDSKICSTWSSCPSDLDN